MKDPLRRFAVDLVERASQGLLDPLVGREDELKRTIQVLSRRRKHNVIFVGEPGVGKSALVQRFLASLLRIRLMTSWLTSRLLRYLGHLSISLKRLD